MKARTTSGAPEKIRALRRDMISPLVTLTFVLCRTDYTPLRFRYGSLPRSPDMSSLAGIEIQSFAGLDSEQLVPGIDISNDPIDPVLPGRMRVADDRFLSVSSRSLPRHACAQPRKTR